MGSNIVIRDHRGPPTEGKDPQTLGILNRATASAWAMQEIGLLLHSILQRRMKVHLAWYSWASEVTDPASAIRVLIPTSPNAAVIRVCVVFTPCRFSAAAQPAPQIECFLTDLYTTVPAEVSQGIHYHPHRDDNIGPINWTQAEVSFAVVGSHVYRLRIRQTDLVQMVSVTVFEQPRDWLDPAVDVAVDATDFVETKEILSPQLADLWDAVQRAFDDQGAVMFAWSPHNEGQARTIPISTAALANIFDTTLVAYNAAALGFYTWPQFMGTFETDDLEVVIWVELDFSATPAVNAGRQVRFLAPASTIGTIDVQGYDPGAAVDPWVLRLQTKFLGASAFDDCLVQVFAKNPSAAEAMSIKACGMYVHAPFDPRALGGALKVWLAADKITGLADGAAISQWSDLSGNGNHAVQATGANQPIYKTGIWQGKPVVRFDGANDYLRIADAANYKSISPYCWVITKSDNVAATYQAVIGYAHAVSGVGFRWGFSINPTGNDTIRIWQNNVSSDVANAFTNIWRKLWFICHDNYLTRDDVVYGLAGYASNDITYPTATGIYVGAESDLAAGSFFDGDIAEIIIVDGTLTNVEQLVQINGYLSEKYGLITGKDWTA